MSQYFSIIACFGLIYLSGFQEVNAYKILAISTLPQPDEYNLVTSLINALNDRGHQVTLVTRFNQGLRHDNIKQILIEDNKDFYKEFLTLTNYSLDNSFFPNLLNIFGKGEFVVKDIINNQQMRKLIKYDKFDLIIYETFMCEALYGLGEYFAAPMVGLTSFGTSSSLDVLVGNISPTSFIPNLFMEHSFEVTFLYRCLNVVLYLVDKMIYNYLYLPHQRQLYKEIFPNATQTFDQANRNFSLVLLNQHFSLNFPRPYVPNMLEVAGLHIEDKAQRLPLRVQQFLDNAHQGAIYTHLFLGAKSNQLDLKYSLIFHQTFKNLTPKVIWNMDHHSSMPYEESANILQISNVSHHSILAQPQVKLFITSCELPSLIDAVYFAKPILCIPLSGNQQFSSKMALRMAETLSLKLKHLTEAKLKQTIEELLTNPQYLKKIKELSLLFHDQPMKPKDKAIYWIEYVLRHKGAVHLRSKGRFLNFWQFNNIDVILAALVVFSFIIFGICLTMKCFYGLIFGNKKSLKIKFKRN